MEFRRKIYSRGSSYETTIPMPMLFSADKEKKYCAIFIFDSNNNRWYVKIEEETEKRA
jgi:hypothetical protein